MSGESIAGSHVLWQIVRRSPGTFAADQALQVVRSCLPLVPGLVVKAVLDRLSAPTPVTDGIWWLLALMVGAVLGRVTALLICVAYDGVCEALGIGVLARSGFDRALAKAGAQRLPQPVGDVVSRLTGDTGVVSSIIVNTMMVAGAGVQAFVAFVVLFSIDPLITAVVCAPMLGAGILINLASTRIKRYHQESRKASGAVSAFLGEVFNSAQAIKLSGAQPAVMNRFRAVNEERRQKSLQSRLFTDVFLGSIWTNSSALGTGVVLVMAVGAIRAGSLSVGDLALFIVYVGWMTDVTALLSQNLARQRQARVSAQRIEDALPGSVTGLVPERAGATATPPARPPGPPGEAPADPAFVELRVDGLTCLHPESGRGVSDVGLTVRRGDFVVVTGRVGAGKTTLLRAVLGLLPRQGGSVTWNGREVAELLPPSIGYTPQVPRLFSESVRDNILCGEPADDARIDAAVDSAILERDLRALDDGLGTMVGPKGTRLSGGQVQRLAAARMFYRRPALLVFDDLSSALDVGTEALLWQRLFAEPDATCLAVSHRRAVLSRATTVIVLDQGRVVARGPLPELLKTSPVLRELWQDEPVDLDRVGGPAVEPEREGITR